MLSFVQSWFTPGANPVGVDFGTDCLRLAQVEKEGGECRLIAAASAAVPEDIRSDPSARLGFFTRTLRALWSMGNFRGRRAVLALPAASMHIQHLRLPRMDDEALKKALPWEARGKLPIDPSNALIRHLVAGDVYADAQPRSEVILMAARGEFVESYLSAAAKARLEVMAMTIEPRAVVDCFLNIYRRKTDTNVTNCFIDMGCSATRAVIAHGGQILFARSIPVGGDHFNRAVAAGLAISVDEAKRLRFADAAPAENESTERRDVRGADAARIEQVPGTECGTQNLFETAGSRSLVHCEAGGQQSTAVATPSQALLGARHSAVDAAARCTQQSALEGPLSRLVEELTLCRRYHESTFPNRPVQRLIFVGGEARQRMLCQTIAKGLGIGAQIGDPLVRMGRTTEVGIESGIDRRLPQPAWAVAIGLSMGTPGHDPRSNSNR